ncbi:DUF2703 domain-containing protein [Halopenitus sp. H-Gu1]|uniref:DUF2703 domain-containing protein n=1 Tax=Halopenitus sp. H-Gu1 TaxID=3242697 RepID=UPI00359E8E90
MRDPTAGGAISVVQSSAEEYTRRTVTVDLLYLDNESCDRCVGTEDALETAIKRIEPIVEPLDVGITVRDIHVSTLEGAKATQLAVSPTIRIDGHDIQPDYRESTCEPCGDLRDCADDVDCRLWRYRGEEYTTAPVGLIIEALIRAIGPTQTRFDTSPNGEADQLSSNVQNFFSHSEDVESECGCGC